MKHRLLFLLLLLATMPSWAAQPATSSGQRTAAIRPAKLGAELRTSWLGMSKQQFRRLVPEQRLGAPTSISYYTRPGETLVLGGYRVTGISYGFYKDQLCCIEVRVLGEANCRGIQALLTRSYGPASSATGQRWENAQLRLLYNEMPKGYATVVVASPSLLAQYQAEQLLAPNEAA